MPRPMSTTSIDPTLDLFAEIEELKRSRKAVILAHYYQDPDIQDIADFLGDSLDLAHKARDVDEAEVILFSGVHFMAETAKILNPAKIVLVPDLDAGCSLADSCPADELRAWKAKNPDHAVVTYINCTAATKAESDIICTSSNAEKVLRSIPEDQPVLFAPDRNLGGWLAKRTGREMELWPGTCQVHITFSERKLCELMAQHPEAKFIAHPECEDEILRHAAFVGSTKKLLDYVQDDPAEKIIIGTEAGIIHTMQKAAPQKTLIRAPVVEEGTGCEACGECPHMKLNTIEKIYVALRELQPRIELDDDLIARARRPLERMLSIA